MVLRQLSSFGSSFLPRSRPPLCRAGFRSSSASSSSSSLPQFTPAPHPWWSVRGFPPWPPRLPHFHPAALWVFSGRTFHPRSFNPGNFPGRWGSYHTSSSLMMERPDKDREPPHKRRKSAEERRNVKEKEEHKGGATRGKDGGSKTEQHHRDSSSESFSRTNHHLKDGGRERGSSESRKSVSKENSRYKETERTRSADKERQRRDSSGRDESRNRGWSSQQQRSRSRPEQDGAPVHKPNPWFRGGGAEEPRGWERNVKAPEGLLREKRSDGGPSKGPLSWPRGSFPPLNPRQEAATNMEPPPPGTSPPVRRQQDVKPVKVLQRHWEEPPCSTGAQPPGHSAAFDFSVMSYNILSQDLLQDNAYLYHHCNPGVLPWNHRLPNLLSEIRQYDADILCLQEVQEDHYENQIKPALQALGYQCEYKKRTGSKPDGCAVVFKSSRLSLLSSNPVEFLRRGDALLDRDNVGLVVLLRPNDAVGQSDPSAFICVANTHLLYNPRRGDIKLAQLAILLAEISRLSRLPDGSTNPVVLCGDFNSTPWSPLYSFLTTGHLDYRGLQIGAVSGQENSPRGQRFLTCPIWSDSLGIDRQCRYTHTPAAESTCSSPTAVEGAISNLSVEDLAIKAAVAFNRARIEHGLKLQSSYQHHLMHDGRPEITTCHSRTAMTVDYILYSPDFLTPPSLPGGRGLQLLGRLSLVGQSELEEVNGLPNQHHSSDHLPLLARFCLRR